jgi:hypothetical protein
MYSTYDKNGLGFILGYFSPLGRLFTVGSFFENFRRSANFWATFFQGKVIWYIFMTKMGWASLWATFSQAHPVTLVFVVECR